MRIVLLSVSCLLLGSVSSLTMAGFCTLYSTRSETIPLTTEAARRLWMEAHPGEAARHALHVGRRDRGFGYEYVQ